MSRLSKSQDGLRLSINSASSMAFARLDVSAVSIKCHEETTAAKEPDSMALSSLLRKSEFRAMLPNSIRAFWSRYVRGIYRESFARVFCSNLKFGPINPRLNFSCHRKSFCWPLCKYSVQFICIHFQRDSFVGATAQEAPHILRRELRYPYLIVLDDMNKFVEQEPVRERFV